MRNQRGEELTTPEQIAQAEEASLWWARESAKLCHDCGAPQRFSRDNPAPGPRCGDASWCRIRKAAYQAAALYEKRTRAIAAGSTDVTIAHHATRVAWSEVGLVGPDDRAAFQPAFEAAMKRRQLLGVLRGKVTASDWVLRHPKVRRVIS